MDKSKRRRSDSLTVSNPSKRIKLPVPPKPKATPYDSKLSQIENLSDERILNLVEDYDAPVDTQFNQRPISEIAKELSTLEKENSSLRANYSDQPKKFLQSELRLFETLNLLLSAATQQPVVNKLLSEGILDTLLKLFIHENFDVTSMAVSVLAEILEVEDVVSLSHGIRKVFESLLKNDLINGIKCVVLRILPTGIEDIKLEIVQEQTLQSLVSILENILMVNVDWLSNGENVIEKSAMFEMLLQITKGSEVDYYESKLAASEMLYQSAMDCLILFKNNKVDVGDYTESLVSLLSTYVRKKKIKTEGEADYVSNVFLTLCSFVDDSDLVTEFIEKEGIELMLFFLKGKSRLCRKQALKVIDFALAKGGKPACERLVDCAGLGVVFSYFNKKRESDVLENLYGIVVSLLNNLEDVYYLRVMNKLSEANYQKIELFVRKFAEIYQKIRDIPKEVDKDDIYVVKVQLGLAALFNLAVIFLHAAVVNSKSIDVALFKNMELFLHNKDISFPEVVQTVEDNISDETSPFLVEKYKGLIAKIPK